MKGINEITNFFLSETIEHYWASITASPFINLFFTVRNILILFLCLNWFFRFKIHISSYLYVVVFLECLGKCKRVICIEIRSCMLLSFNSTQSLLGFNSRLKRHLFKFIIYQSPIYFSLSKFNRSRKLFISFIL